MNSNNANITKARVENSIKTQKVLKFYGFITKMCIFVSRVAVMEVIGVPRSAKLAPAGGKL